MHGMPQRHDGRMRILVVVLSAALTAGLPVYFAFSNRIGVMGENVVMPINLFVALIPTLCVAASVTTFVIRHLLAREEANVLRELRDRVQRLEAARPDVTSSAPSVPTPAAAR